MTQPRQNEGELPIVQAACIEDDPLGQIRGELIEIRGLINFVLSELRQLRRSRGPSEEDLSDLLQQIFEAVTDSGFVASWIFEFAYEDDPVSKRLRTALSKCLNDQLTIRRLAYLLGQSVGEHGGLVLKRIGHSRDGEKYRIQEVMK